MLDQILYSRHKAVRDIEWFKPVESDTLLFLTQVEAVEVGSYSGVTPSLVRLHSHI